ncbi:MAG: hypothetical protein ACRDD1_04090 [Planctomycetia bacterium]
MTTFVDGPAKGVVLELNRLPKLLRVVRNSAGGWDALDQLDDVAKPDEKIFVYRRCTPVTKVHFLFAKKRNGSRGEWVRYADYRHTDLLVSNTNRFRDNTQWRAWAEGYLAEAERMAAK